MFMSIVLCSAFWAVILPTTFVLVRESTKLHRRGIVEDLARVFQKTNAGVASIPSFEFVKYKYFAFTDQGSEACRPRADFRAHHWVLSAVPLVLITFTLNTICLSIVVRAALHAPLDLGVRWLGHDGPAPLSAWVLLASYVGAMLFMLRAFNQAINNFDLSPFSLVGAAVNLIVAVAAGLLFVFGVARIPAAAAGADLAGPAGFPLTLVGAFTAGYLPGVAVRNVLRWSNLRLRKSDDEDVYKSFKSVPLEVIDGIDSEIRSRFEDYHIVTVQNLAAANPLMLFVETPYGVYQIMDWVAQAQLCATVGPKALVSLWRLGIRTIFDLERVALDERCKAPALTQAIGAILWAEPGQDLAGRPIVPDLAAIEADIRFRLENPHVLRLRQIFNEVSDSIGTNARTLVGAVDCSAAPGRLCPFAPPRPASAA